MSYCKKGENATVSYSFDNAKKTIAIKNNSPIDILTSGNKNSSVKCWRFSGQGRHNDYYYDFFTCGITADWHDNGDYLQPTIEGKLFLDGIFGVRHGSGSIASVSDDSARPNYIKLGDCSSCSSNICAITILNNNVKIFSDSGQCSCNYTVACGNECPDGYVKCHSDSYPGYCCLPCNDIEDRIDALTQLAKSKTP